MAVRLWQVHPDHEVQTQRGPVAAVSRQAIDQAFLDGATLVDKAGGVFTVICGRHPTDLPGEMVTTGLICEWKDRTDAKAAPEPRADVLPVGVQAMVDNQTHPGGTLADADRAFGSDSSPSDEAPEPEHRTLPFEHEQLPPIDDGIDESTLPAEDDSAVEAELAGR